MRDVKRIEKILDTLNVIWHLVPDWRFTQLILNIFPMDTNPSLFYLEDDMVLERLESILNEYLKQKQNNNTELDNKESESSFED